MQSLTSTKQDNFAQRYRSFTTSFTAPLQIRSFPHISESAKSLLCLAMAVIVPVVAVIKFCSGPLCIKGPSADFGDLMEREKVLIEEPMLAE